MSIKYLKSLDDYLILKINKKIKMKKTQKKQNFTFSEEELKRIVKEAIEEAGNPWKIVLFLFIGFTAFLFVIIGMSQPYL